MAQRSGGSGFDFETQLRRKPQRPQNPQWILGEPFRWVADRPNDPGFKVVDPTDLVDNFLVISEGIDREIATL